MRQTTLGKSGIRVSALCLGTDLYGSRIDTPAAFRLLDQFRESGGSFIDTGNFYAAWIPGCSGGESETAIGTWMKDRGARRDMVIASKIGFDYPGCPGGLNAAEIERECEKSLRRLQTETLDLYYAHRDDSATPLEETMEAFARLIRAGKVRTIGASNLKVWRIAEANTVATTHGWPQYCVVEQRHTYFRPRHGADFGPQVVVNPDLRDYCRARGVSLVGYSILLQGAYTRGDRAVPAQYAGPDAEERMTVLRAVAGETGSTPNQVIIAWMLAGDPPVLPIVAGSQPKQLAENLQALEIVLTPDQVERLNTAGNPAVTQAWLR
jgi:aryl-alcohol dehydrogenase-like predicted oxidoreductase